MSSLYSLATSGKAKIPVPYPEVDELGMVKALHQFGERLLKPQCICVDAQNVYVDLFGGPDTKMISMSEFCSLPVMPPYPSMWFEFKTPRGTRTAVQVYAPSGTTEGLGEEATISLDICGWQEHQGYALAPVFVATIELNKATGHLVDTDYNLVANWWQGEADHWSAAVTWSQVAFHGLARMHCKNAKLEVKSDGHKGGKKKRGCRPVPMSVWHQITVSAMPQRRAAERQEPSDGVIRRPHRIRGHYADYRDGKGLFGNHKLKALFWIPFHWEGEPEKLGQVVPSYLV